MTTRVNVNGHLGTADGAVISVMDRGFLFGLSVYESIRTYGGSPFLVAKHLARLRASGKALEIPIPLSDEELMRQISATLDAAGNAESSIRVLASAGADIPQSKGDAPSRATTMVVIVKSLTAPPARAYERGVRVALVDVVRTPPGSVDPQVKSSNLVVNLLAMRQAKQREAFEAILLNYRGEVCEASSSNVFLVRDGRVITPPLSAGILAGLTRELTIQLTKDLGLRLEEATLMPPDLITADEIFLTASSKEILPVREVDDHVVGDGRPGPVSLSLLAAYRRRVRDMTN